MTHVLPFLFQGLHPRLITEGFELARNKALEVRGFISALFNRFLCMMLGLRVKWQCAAQLFHFHNVQSVTIKINHSCKIFSYANKDDLLNHIL